MKFGVYWKNGQHEIIKGNGFADAFTRAGYGQGALRALDVWHPGDEVKYEWSGKEWRNKELLEKFSCPA